MKRTNVTYRLPRLTRAGLLVACALAAGRGYGADMPRSAEAARQNQNLCGPNSLYLFLRLHGYSVGFDEIHARLPVDERGVSLLQIRDAANGYGADVRVRQFEGVPELARCRLPVIAHFNRGVSGRTMGHYVVVVAVEDEGGRGVIRFLDGTSGQRVWYTWDDFRDRWSGYILERRPASGDEGLLIGTCLVLGVSILFLWFARRGVAARRTLAALVCMVWLVPPPARSPAASGPGVADAEVWRTTEADAINALYLQLRIMGHETDYATVRSRVRSENGRTSLTDLKVAAGRCGLRTRIIKCSPAELADQPLPLIAHLDDARAGGRFALVFAPAGDGNYGLVECGEAVLKELSADEFRRAWSGYALIADHADPRPWLTSAGAGALVLVCYTFWRFKTRRSGR